MSDNRNGRRIAPALAVLLALAALGGAGGARAADRVGLELNRLEPVDGACRAYMVFENATAAEFTAFKLDLVMFDRDGVISKRLAVEAAPLPPGKTSVKLFDVQGLDCAGIGRVLLNDVMACATADGASADCTALARPASKTEAEFFK